MIAIESAVAFGAPLNSGVMQATSDIPTAKRLLISGGFATVAGTFILLVFFPGLPGIGGSGYETLPAVFIAGFGVMYVAAPRLARSASRARSHPRGVAAGTVLTLATYVVGAMLYVVLARLVHHLPSIVDAFVETLLVAIMAPLYASNLLLLALPLGTAAGWIIYVYALPNMMSPIE